MQLCESHTHKTKGPCVMPNLERLCAVKLASAPGNSVVAGTAVGDFSRPPLFAAALCSQLIQGALEGESE